jgi:hypothetical protein
VIATIAAWSIFYHFEHLSSVGGVEMEKYGWSIRRASRLIELLDLTSMIRRKQIEVSVSNLDAQCSREI